MILFGGDPSSDPRYNASYSLFSGFELAARYKKCFPSGKACGQRWVVCSPFSGSLGSISNSVCHSESPSWPGIAAPPAGLSYQSEAELENAADLVYQASVVAKTMPLGNVTGMSDEERQQIALWYAGLNASK